LSERLEARPGSRVLDVGTGSGLLAIAARKLQAPAVVGNDNDPIAIRVARENAALNGVQVDFDLRDVGEQPGPFDLILANILANTLCELAPAVAAQLAPGGVVLLSGILTPQEEEVRDAYRAAGLRRSRGATGARASGRCWPWSGRRRSGAGDAAPGPAAAGADRARARRADRGGAPLPARRAAAGAGRAGRALRREGPGLGGHHRTRLRLPGAGARREGPAGGPAIWLLFALAKGEKNELVVQKATELGVARLVPWAAERSVVRLDAGKGAERAERWSRIAGEAARQCGAGRRAGGRGAGAAGGRAGGGAARSPAGGAARPGGRAARRPRPGRGAGGGAGGGPRGRLDRSELDTCQAAGAARGALGPRTLRAETAAIAGVAVLQAVVGDMGGEGGTAR